MKRELLWDIWNDIGNAPHETFDCFCPERNSDAEAVIRVYREQLIYDVFVYPNGAEHTFTTCGVCGGFVSEIVDDPMDLWYRRQADG